MKLIMSSFKSLNYYQDFCAYDQPLYFFDLTLSHSSALILTKINIGLQAIYHSLRENNQ